MQQDGGYSSCLGHVSGEEGGGPRTLPPAGDRKRKGQKSLLVKFIINSCMHHSSLPPSPVGCTSHFFSKCWYSRFTSWQIQNYNPRGNKDRFVCNLHLLTYPFQFHPLWTPLGLASYPDPFLNVGQRGLGTRLAWDRRKCLCNQQHVRARQD